MHTAMHPSRARAEVPAHARFVRQGSIVVLTPAGSTRSLRLPARSPGNLILVVLSTRIVGSIAGEADMLLGNAWQRHIGRNITQT